MNTLSILTHPLTGFVIYLKSLLAYILDSGEQWYQEHAPCDNKGAHTQYGLYREPRSTTVFADSNFGLTTPAHQQDVAEHIKSLGYTFGDIGPLKKIRWWHNL